MVIHIGYIWMVHNNLRYETEENTIR